MTLDIAETKDGNGAFVISCFPGKQEGHAHTEAAEQRMRNMGSRVRMAYARVSAVLPSFPPYPPTW